MNTLDIIRCSNWSEGCDSHLRMEFNVVGGYYELSMNKWLTKKGGWGQKRMDGTGVWVDWLWTEELQQLHHTHMQTTAWDGHNESQTNTCTLIQVVGPLPLETAGLLLYVAAPCTAWTPILPCDFHSRAYAKPTEYDEYYMRRGKMHFELSVWKYMSRNKVLVEKYT